MGELKSKALKGVMWNGIEKVGIRFVSFIVTIIIARILSPSDYGIIGMIMVFISIAGIFIDSGMGQALVQKKDRSQSDMSTLFYFNIGVSTICYVILFFAAPYISDFYNVAILTPILRILGLNLIISSLGAVQRANLYIALDFRTLASINIAVVAVSGAIGIIMAYSGFGVWALVGQQITSALVTSLLLWIIGKWHPITGFSKTSFQKLWKYGSKLLAAGIVATIMREIYTITIGKFYNSSELGYYTRATQTTDLVSSTSNDVINAVTFPILSSLQDDRSRMIEVYSRMLGMTAFFIFPIMVGLAVIATPLISVLLTDKWLPTVPLLQWLCFARMFTPISALNMNILNAVGRSDLFMKLDLSKLPLTILTMIITIPLGVKAIVIGNFVNTFICYFVNAYLPGKMFDFGVKAQFKIFWRILLATALMVLATWLSMQFFNSMILKLIIGIVVGTISYAIFAYIFKIREMKEVLNLIKSKIKR